MGAVVLIVSVACYAYRRSQPEFLPGCTTGGQVHAGRIYFVKQTQGPSGIDKSIYVQPVDGGAPRLLAGTHFLHVTTALTVRGSFVYYLVEEPGVAVGTGDASADMPLSSTQTRADHSPAHPPGHPASQSPRSTGVTFGRFAAHISLPSAFDLMRVPTIGGAPRKVGGIRGPVWAFTEDSVYWIDTSGRSDQGTIVMDADGLHVLGKVMATSLADGSTHPVTSRPASCSALFGNGKAVFWTTSQSSVQPDIDLHMVRAGDTVETVIRNVPRRAFHHLSPVFFENRVFWLEHDGSSSGGTGIAPCRLMSAAPDGGSRQNVTAARIQYMAVHRGRLYLLVSKGRSVAARVSVVLLHPRSAQPLEVIRSLPSGANGFQFDEKYLYFAIDEEQHSWQEVLKFDQTGLLPTRVHRLFRVPLPD